MLLHLTYLRCFRVIPSLLLIATIAHSKAEGAPSPSSPDVPAPNYASPFYIRELTPDLNHPMEMAISNSGDVFIVERTGAVKLFSESEGSLRTILSLHVDHAQGGGMDKECGLMGITLDPEFDRNHWLYVFYAAHGGESLHHNHTLSRFTFDPKKKVIDPSTEKAILLVNAYRKSRIHEAGSLAFGPDGNLFLSVGDNQSKQDYLFSCTTSADSSDLRGKILRITPTPDGSYTIPEGNLFPVGTKDTRPEIYIMGLRNPFRINVDQKTGWLLWGENGPPDRFSGERGLDRDILPLGYDEFNLAKKAGFYGYPMIIGQQEAYADINHETGVVVGHFNPDKPVNTHPHNKGLRELPPSQPPLLWYSGISDEFPELGQGGESAIGGPVYHWSKDYPQDLCLPKQYDNTYFISEYVRSWVKAVKLTKDGQVEKIGDILPRSTYGNPTNLKVGPKGRLHVLYYSNNKKEAFAGEAEPAGTLIRLENAPGDGLKTILEVLGGDLTDGLPKKHPGVELMTQTDCLGCHRAEIGVVGPSYFAIAQRYEPTEENYALLTGKVKEGGIGTWGELMIMPPHPTLDEPDLRQMLDAIFTLRKKEKAPKNDSGWQTLFDGKSLNNWSTAQEGEVKVENGEIQILSTKNLWLVHDKTYQDFELQLDLKMPNDGHYNSGVGFRCTASDGKPTGYQAEVHGAKTGSIYGIGSGWVYPEGEGKTQWTDFLANAGDAFVEGDWNHIKIRCQGQRIEVHVNDVKVSSTRDKTFSKGSFALQHHGRGGVHHFRNIRVKELK